MNLKELLKKVVPPSTNRFHSFVIESNAAYDKIMHTVVSEIDKTNKTNQEILEKINKIDENDQEILEKVTDKEYEIPASMKPPYFFDLRLRAIQWETFTELEHWLDTLDNAALFELQDINTRIPAPSAEYQAFQPDFLLYHNVHEVREHLPRYQALYDLLADDASKRVLVSLFLSHVVNSNRLLWKHFQTVVPGVAPWEHIYFNPSIMHHEEGDDEVFVDCGAYDGAGAFNFINHYSREYKRMYLYELDPVNAAHVKEAVDILPNIVTRNAAAGSKHGRMSASIGSAQGSHLGGGTGGLDYTAEVVALDEDITEPITFLKMDIEGAELDALKGASSHIKNEHPKLAICVYHKREDAVDLAEYILSLNPDYKLYLRHEEHYMYCGTVLYAVP